MLRYRFPWATVLLVAVLPAVAEGQTVLPIPNGDFSRGLEGWRLHENAIMPSLSDEQAAKGTHALKIVDDCPQQSSRATATRVPIDGAGAYEIRGMHFPVSGDGLGIYVRVLDRDGRNLSGESHLRGLGGSDRRWRRFALPFYTPDEAAFLELQLHSYSHALVEAYLDDLHFVKLDKGMEPPWEGTYKIRAHETERLTPADIVGPDGIVYPNWTKTGVQGGIPEVPVFAEIERFGGRADAGVDSSAALQAAIEAAGAVGGGGAILFGEGTYYLDYPVTIRDDGVVIRGQGADKTRLVFRYAIPENGVAFYALPPGTRVGRNTRIEMHCRPQDLMKMEIFVGQERIGAWERSLHSGNTFAFARNGRDVVARVPDGEHTLRGVATYRDGSELTGELPIVVDSNYRDSRRPPSSRAAITFEGAGFTGPRILLAEDGRRGDMALTLESTDALQAGDQIIIDGPATERWKTLTRNRCPWGVYRRYALVVESVQGNRIAVTQPLRIDFPVVDESWVQKVVPVQYGGVEDLAIEQTEDLWISAVLFSNAWNCWARGVDVHMAGRFPVYGNMAKWCEIRDCVFDDAWYKGGGGTAYAGWELSWDCLMENVTTYKYRHAPLFQWSASGNVIRKSVFHQSDGQWHAGWTNENLFEQCVIDAATGTGSYGYGMWASPPEDEAHGPNGPRNVVYNCDVRSPRTGLWMGGMNENWLILHNRFVVEQGQGVFAKTASFDHIIQGNVFVLADERSPMVFLATPDCIGVEIISNRLYGGSGRFVGGAGKPALLEENEAFPLHDAPRPQPEVPSIYEWQQQHRGKR